MDGSFGALRRRRRLFRGAQVAVALGVALTLVGALVHPGSPSSAVMIRVAATGGGGGGGVQPVVNATLNLTDRPAFAPKYLTVNGPAKVNLTLVNQGTIAHTFTLVSRPNFVLNTSETPTQLNQFFAKNLSQTNVTVAGGNSTTVQITFTSIQVGYSYEFVSQIAYQFQAGMFGFLNVSGAPSGPGLMAQVNASATALAWVPNLVGINASAFPVTIDMQVFNQGSSTHTFYLEGQSNYTLLPGNFTQYFLDHPPLASVNLPTNPGDSVWANFTLTQPGIYEYICTVPGHFAAGMNGFLYVDEPLPAPVIPPSTAIVSEWVLFAGGGLLGVGGLLAAAGLLVGRFPRSPPSSGGH
jgi:uncharacterized cupredoxin-like copper-binding protein